MSPCFGMLFPSYKCTVFSAVCQLFVLGTLPLVASVVPPLAGNPQALSGWCERLTDSSFTQQVMSPGTHTLVAFVAPWCEQCKALEPVYDALCRSFAYDRDRIFVATMESSTNGPEEEVGNAYDVSSFPAIKLYGANVEHNPLEPGGEGLMVDVESYTGPVDASALVRFVNERVSGTSRLPAPPAPSAQTGLLDTSFGLLPKLNSLVADYYETLHLSQEAGASPTAALATALSEGKRLMELGEVAAANSTAARYYLKVLTKVDQSGQDAIKAERGRLKRLLTAAPGTFAAGKARSLETSLNMYGKC
jgi:thiol-disulfide isomerase/thioredoxin